MVGLCSVGILPLNIISLGKISITMHSDYSIRVADCSIRVFDLLP